MINIIASIHVKEGDGVKVDEVIGASGRTGFCRGKTGYHLHFGLKVNNEYQDPLKYVDIEIPQQKLIADNNTVFPVA